MGTVASIQVCVKSGCVVFPRYVSTIREARTCCGSVWLKNEYESYNFVDTSWYNSLGGSPGNWSSGNGTGYSLCTQGLFAHGRVPTYDTIRGTGRKVRVYAQTNQDYGKTVTIFGIDNGSQPLMHRDENGDWREGWVLTFQNPYAETEGYVSGIERVLKDRTQKPVTMFAWNTTDSVLENLATYDPGETNPSFARYQLHGYPMQLNADGTERLRTVVALVKLNFVPVEFDTDLVLIDNLTALKFMMQAILSEEGDNDALAQSKINKAIAELNYQVRDSNYNNQISVQANSVGCIIANPI
jgi:hypothetical protein